jgi:pSer/pThr/pTyr-binding forkhead associated (FHA) protein
VLDDRSLNGVFVNGERVEWRALSDGDEIVVGRYRLHYVEVVAGAALGGGTAIDPASAPLEAEA